MTELRRQTSDKVAITVCDTIVRCRPRVTGDLVEKVVADLGFLPKDADAADVGRRVRELLAAPAEKGTDSEPQGDDVPNISSLGKDSPSGESNGKPSNSKADPLAEKDIERLRNTLASLQEAAKKINKSAARRAVEAQPDVAAPLIQEIGSLLQQIDRAVAIRLPKAECPERQVDLRGRFPKLGKPAPAHVRHAVARPVLKERFTLLHAFDPSV
ncbi:hypothetical protein [Streptomyces qinglanensis]|uniref:hypothetical protein n=1 Tax=Streptomyces qinglanensis TaxID=943816 RepID=UPI003D72D21B